MILAERFALHEVFQLCGNFSIDKDSLARTLITGLTTEAVICKIYRTKV